MSLAETRTARILARQLFDGVGATPRSDRVVEITEGKVSAIRPATADDARGQDITEHDIVAPGFIDLQINGAADAQFNFAPTVETLKTMAEGARQGGTAHILPTFITAPDTDYLRAISATEEAIRTRVPGILGLHLEGPFLSHDRPGIHDPAAIRSLEEDDLSALTSSDLATLLLTVAPEALPPGTMERLSNAGIRVFAGHSQATADQIAQAQAEGLVGVTHLFNAMSQLTGREPGVVGATFASQSLYAGIIADGHHVDWRNVALAARLMPDRLCLVTDAMLTLAGTQTGFELHGVEIRLEDGRLTDREGRLAGAHVSLVECLRNVVEHAGIELGTALKMLSTNPAHALGLERELGQLEVGKRASITCLSRDLKVTGVYVDGQDFSPAGS